jgi:hypothetical protein
MNDYNALYTWAMDRQAQIERDAAQRRMVDDSRRVKTHNNLTRLRWPLARRSNDRKAA